MARQHINRCIMIASDKTPTRKKQKRTIAQILREAYARHCPDRATRSALRQLLKR